MLLVKAAKPDLPRHPACSAGVPAMALPKAMELSLNWSGAAVPVSWLKSMAPVLNMSTEGCRMAHTMV